MDPEFGRVDKADALRNLFHGAGHLKAPADMEQRVLSALSEAPMKADVPLIPKGAWVTIGMMLGTAIGAGLMLADGSSGSGILPRSVPPQWLDVGPVMDPRPGHFQMGDRGGGECPCTGGPGPDAAEPGAELPARVSC